MERSPHSGPPIEQRLPDFIERRTGVSGVRFSAAFTSFLPDSYMAVISFPRAQRMSN